MVDGARKISFGIKPKRGKLFAGMLKGPDSQSDYRAQKKGIWVNGDIPETPAEYKKRYARPRIPSMRAAAKLAKPPSKLLRSRSAVASVTAKKSAKDAMLLSRSIVKSVKTRKTAKKSAKPAAPRPRPTIKSMKATVKSAKPSARVVSKK